MYRSMVVRAMCVGAWLGSASWLHGDQRLHDHVPVHTHKPHMFTDHRPLVYHRPIFTGHGPAVHHRPVQDVDPGPEIATQDMGDAVMDARQPGQETPQQEGTHQLDTPPKATGEDNAGGQQFSRRNYIRFEKNLKQTLGKLHHSFDVLKRKNHAQLKDFQAVLENYESAMKKTQDTLSLIFKNKNEEMMWTSHVLPNILEAFEKSSEMLKKNMEALSVTYQALREGHLKILPYQGLLQALLAIRRLPFMQKADKGRFTAEDLKELEEALRVFTFRVERERRSS